MDENRFTIFTTSRQAGKCIHPSTEITVRNKKTGLIERLTIKEFYDNVTCTQPNELI